MSLPPLVRAESYQSYAEFKSLLKEYIESDQAVNHASLEPFLQFFSDRFDEIKLTDAMYTHAPHSKINQCCWAAAQILGNVLNIHPYRLLMPSIAMTDEQLARLQFHEFILADDGITPIEI